MTALLDFLNSINTSVCLGLIVFTHSLTLNIEQKHNTYMTLRLIFLTGTFHIRKSVYSRSSHPNLQGLAHGLQHRLSSFTSHTSLTWN